MDFDAEAVHPVGMPRTAEQNMRSHLRVVNTMPTPEECRRIRERAGVSQTVVAESIGVTRSAVSAWEAGRRRPMRSVAAAYLRVLEVLREAVAA